MPVAHDADSHVFQLGDGERVLGYSVSVPAAHHVDAQGRPSLRNVKRPLVYVHGFPTCRLESKMLRHAAPGLLARDGDDPTATATAVFDVCIAVDRPGVGLSTRYPRDPTLGDFGLELAELLCALGRELPWTLLALSGGGPLAVGAIAPCLRQGLDMRGLVLVSALADVSDRFDRCFRDCNAARKFAFLFPVVTATGMHLSSFPMARLRARVRAIPDAAVDAERRKREIRAVAAQMQVTAVEQEWLARFPEGAAALADFLEAYLEGAQATGGRGVADELRLASAGGHHAFEHIFRSEGRGSVQVGSELRSVCAALPPSVPVLIVHGREDGMVPLSHAEWYKDNIVHAEQWTLADGHGHYTPLLEPGFPERIRELLDGKDDGLADMTDLLDAEEGGGPAPLRRFSSGFARAAP